MTGASLARWYEPRRKVQKWREVAMEATTANDLHPLAHNHLNGEVGFGGREAY